MVLTSYAINEFQSFYVAQIGWCFWNSAKTVSTVLMYILSCVDLAAEISNFA